MSGLRITFTLDEINLNTKELETANNEDPLPCSLAMRCGVYVMQKNTFSKRHVLLEHR